MIKLISDIITYNNIEITFVFEFNQILYGLLREVIKEIRLIREIYIIIVNSLFPIFNFNFIKLIFKRLI